MTPHPETSALHHEWTTLQNNHEQYEKNALLIKLLATVLCFAALLLALSPPLAGLILLLLWLQEGILRTSQARLGDRILRIEALLREGEPPVAAAFQLHSEWLATRGTSGGLLAEYARNALRPTVAFPYAVLVLVQWAVWVAL
jgi:hypothetical protein